MSSRQPITSRVIGISLVVIAAIGLLKVDPAHARFGGAVEVAVSVEEAVAASITVVMVSVAETPATARGRRGLRAIRNTAPVGVSRAMAQVAATIQATVRVAVSNILKATVPAGVNKLI